eukprot:5205990-Amphidinium_carterae.1
MSMSWEMLSVIEEVLIDVDVVKVVVLDVEVDVLVRLLEDVLVDEAIALGTVCTRWLFAAGP